jgi:pimeloyl-ACP methyl ester carboxylesterase
MSMRTHRGELRAVPANVAFDAGREATGRLAVFVHGLCESDRAWWLAAERSYGDRDTTYGSRLHTDHGWTPLYLSYNTGLHVSDNGEQLSALLDELVAAWPVPVAEVALIGHSMGGLVARGAAHQAHEEDRTWVRSLRHIVGLGSPNTGAPLERFVNAGTHALARLPETRPFATWLNRRSVGIKDLRYGAVARADWSDHDPDERLIDRCAPATLLDGVMYSAASATLSRRADGRFAHDLLVQHASAHGAHPTRRIAFEPEHLFHVGGKHHFDLLNDAQVYAQLSRWLNG